jgi:hypothetical protein
MPMSLHRIRNMRVFDWLRRGTPFSFTEFQMILYFYWPQRSSSALDLLKTKSTVNFLFHTKVLWVCILTERHSADGEPLQKASVYDNVNDCVLPPRLRAVVYLCNEWFANNETAVDVDQFLHCETWYDRLAIKLRQEKQSDLKRRKSFVCQYSCDQSSSQNNICFVISSYMPRHRPVRSLSASCEQVKLSLKYLRHKTYMKKWHTWY